jgi:predicted acylesterase/phospholipase RssA
MNQSGAARVRSRAQRAEVEDMSSARKTQPQKPVRSVIDFGVHEHRILVLQGGGALGAYQAGVYEGLAAAGFAPNWVAGVSIGAINSVLIAGNAPGRRVERLREFWNLVSARAPFILPAGMDFARPMMTRMSGQRDHHRRCELQRPCHDRHEPNCRTGVHGRGGLPGSGPAQQAAGDNHRHCG